jgi:anti-sigma-K factor RskA
MNFTNNTALQDLLAGEYVLGTLKGGARRRFERMCRVDANLQRRVDQWNEHLVALTDMMPDVTPPGHVWQGVVERIPALSPSPKEYSGFWSNLAWWRGLAIAMTLVTIISVGLLTQHHEEQPAVVANLEHPMLVATFSAPDTHQAIAVAVMGQAPGQVMVKVVSPDLQVAKDKALQLWMVMPGSDALISAGVAPAGTADAMKISVADLEKLRHAKALGLSLEPAGGSPQPTHALGFGSWSQVTS